MQTSARGFVSLPIGSFGTGYHAPEKIRTAEDLYCPFIDVHADFQLRGEGQRIQGVDDPYLRYVVGSFNISNNIATLKGDRMEGADRQQQLEAMLRLNGRARWPYPGGGTGQDGRDTLFVDWYFPTLDEMEAQWRAGQGGIRGILGAER